MVLEGDGDGILAEAAGHVPTTALPGGAGNVVVAGHRDTFFRALRNIRMGDRIAFTTTAGTYHYRVENIHKVGPRDVQVLQASGYPRLTLITCYPFNFIGAAPMRFVVDASEIGSPQDNIKDQRLASRNDGAKQLLAGKLPTQDSDSTVRPSPPAGRVGMVQLTSYRPSADSHTAPAAAPTMSSPSGKSRESEGEMAESPDPPALRIPIAKHSEPARIIAESRVDDSLTGSEPHSHKKLGKMRAWLEYIPHHLKKELGSAPVPKSK